MPIIREAATKAVQVNRDVMLNMAVPIKNERADYANYISQRQGINYSSGRKISLECAVAQGKGSSRQQVLDL